MTCFMYLNEVLKAIQTLFNNIYSNITDTLRWKKKPTQVIVPNFRIKALYLLRELSNIPTTFIFYFLPILFSYKIITTANYSFSLNLF